MTTGTTKPVGRPGKPGRHHRIRLTDEQEAVIRAAMRREALGDGSLSDAVAILATRGAERRE